MNNVKIRPANKHDVEILQKLMHELFLDNFQYDPDLNLAWALSEKGRQFFFKIIADPQSCCFIAEINQQAVGYATCNLKNWDYRKSKYLEIESIAVSSKYRSRNIGSKLIDKCIKWAKDNNYRKLYAVSYFKNSRAIAFYKKQGLFEIETGLERDI